MFDPVRHPFIRNLARTLAAVLFLGASHGAPAPDDADPETTRLFATPLVVLDIRLKDSDWQALRLQSMESPKLYAEAEVLWDGRKWKNVGVKLKGSYGSFQGADERPGLTLHFDKFKGARPFAGLTRLHLNNGSQDDSRLNEWFGGELARASGVPAGRCTHAWVRLQGQDRGLYVLRESFTPGFLSAWFGPPGRGDLYDPGTGSDLHPGLEKDQGEEGEHAPLEALIAATAVSDPGERAAALDAVLDRAAFRAFRATESLLGHWDGYTHAANNYRLYRRPSDHRFVFLAHGMDQILGDPDAPIFGGHENLLSRALTGLPGEWEAQASEFRRQVETVWADPGWEDRIRERAAALAGAVAAHDEAQAESLRTLGDELAARVRERRVRARQAVRHTPRELHLQPGERVSLSEGWIPDREDHPGLEARPPAGAEGAWILAAGEPASASWRQTVVLPAGRYRFSAEITTTGVRVAKEPAPRGAGLRVLGQDGRSRSWVTGTRRQRRRHVEFEAEGPVTLVMELRAESGTAAFGAGSLQLERR